MDPLVTGSLISGGFGLAGDLMGGIFGGGSDTAASDARFMNDFAWKQALRNEEEQKLLAREGIRMRVADAEAAGIHPLAAIGVNPAGGGQFGSGGVSPIDRQNPMGPALSNMGQNLSRAAAMMATRQEHEMHDANIDLLRQNKEFVIQQIAESKARIRSMGNPEPQPLSIGNDPFETYFQSGAKFAKTRAQNYLDPRTIYPTTFLINRMLRRRNEKRKK